MRIRTRRTKRRGYHQNGLKQDGVTISMDLCPCCYSYACDPMAMSYQFQNKIRNRLRMGLCPSCGEPTGFCKCKSSLTGDTGFMTHNNKKRRRAMCIIEAREQAHKAWQNHIYLFECRLGEELANEVNYALYRHKTPECLSWKKLRPILQELGLPVHVFAPGWGQ